MRGTRTAAKALIVAMMPFMAAAEPVVLRIEAKRGPSAATAAAQGWAARFPDVVTFPLTDGWNAVALGPMERAEAEAMLAKLKADGSVPSDSFLAPAPAATTPVASTAPAAVAEAPAAEAATATAAEPAPAAAPVEAAPVAEAPPAVDAPAPAGSYLRLQSLSTRAEADTALADWRKRFPEAGLWQLPDGWFAVTLGPVDAASAAPWLDAFRAAGRAPKDAFVATADKLGTVLDAGSTPKLGAPGTAPMPPLDAVQRALRWAGRYDGKVDGKDGPRTRDAIAAEIADSRAAPDAGTAMQALIDSRAAWRTQMGLTRLDDPQSGLSLDAPMDRLVFERNDQGLSIYGPRDGSGAALILYSAPGGQQEMLDFTGLVTALGWVPAPTRDISAGHASLKGQNDTHIGQAEARVVDGRAEGFVLIWPVADKDDQPRIAAEMIDTLTRTPSPEASATTAPTDAAPAVPAN